MIVYGQKITAGKISRLENNGSMYYMYSIL